MIFLHDWLFYF